MSGDTRDPIKFAAGLARDLSARGVSALLLRGQGPPGVPSSRPLEEPFGLDLLVASDAASRARAVLESYDWKYELGNHGSWRILPVSEYLWETVPSVDLYWGIPAAPLPSRAFAALERALWRGASIGSGGYAEPDAESLAVFLSVQAARSSHRREERLRHLSDCLSMASLERAGQIAQRCGTRAALTWAADAAQPAAGSDRSSNSPPSPPVDGAALRAAWRAGSFLAAHAYPRWLRPLICGTPRLGSSVVRCRFSGVEVLAGPGVFVPEISSERLVTASLEAVASRKDPVLVEAGTGCGAIALAIAAGHPGSQIYAVEKYGPPLRWAERNRRRLGQTSVRLYRGSLLDPLPRDLAGRVDVVVANLPYVPARVWPAEGRLVKEAVRGEDTDGLGLYRRLVRQARSFLEPGGRLILEMGPYHVDAYRSYVMSLGYTVERVEPPVVGAVVVTARLSDSP